MTKEADMAPVFAIVRNEIAGTYLGFKLEERGGTCMWREQATGAFHGSTYANRESAVRGLRRLYEEPGTIVEFSHDGDARSGLRVAA